MYRDPLEAFVGISSDKNAVAVDDLLKHQLITWAKLSPDDVKHYLLQEIFNSASAKLDY